MNTFHFRTLYVHPDSVTATFRSIEPLTSLFYLRSVNVDILQKIFKGKQIQGSVKFLGQSTLTNTHIHTIAYQISADTSIWTSDVCGKEKKTILYLNTVAHYIVDGNIYCCTQDLLKRTDQNVRPQQACRRKKCT